MNITFRKAQYTDAVDLGPRLRFSDRRELKATVGARNPVDVLREAIDISTVCWAVQRDGRTEVLLGAAPIEEYTIGSGWMLASDDIYKWRTMFMKLSHYFVGECHEEYLVLTNYIDDRNRASQAWLRRLGFIEGKHNPTYGEGRLPFTEYFSVRNNYV